MNHEKDYDLIRSFHLNAGHSKNSIKTYATAFSKYSDFHQMSLSELLEEAKIEQENNVPESKLKLYSRILSFRNFLIDNHVGNTISTTITKIKTFYHYNRITLPYIPPLNIRKIKKHDSISYEELLTKDEIRKALSIADDNLAMWILVLTSSGSSRCEAKSMTNEMLFKGTQAYHKKDSFEDALEYLSRHDNVVCTCKLTRKKTDKPYYTFLNPETVQFIAQVKLKDKDFNLDDCLLKFAPDYVGRKFRFINDYLKLGHAGGYRRFRPHMLRKFNATHLNQGSHKEVLGMDIVDNLHGRGKGATREAYFKDNPEVLKLSYIKCMNNVSLYHRYTHEMVDGEVIVYAEKL